MPDNEFPLLIEPEALESRLGADDLLVIDLSRPATHAQLHVPGARLLDYGEIVARRGNAGGALPDAGQLGRALGSVGLTDDRYVVAYDDEGGGKAARLLWTLELLGHRRYSLLNGGLHAWLAERHPLTTEPTAGAPTAYRAQMAPEPAALADADFVLAHIGSSDIALLDARSPAEYTGEKRYAARGGHIPGAINLEWTEAMDQARNLRLRSPEELKERLESFGIGERQTVVTYCQTHHRSAHTWFWLHWLGYRAMAYPGSWSEWGNREELPVEVGE